MFMMSYVAFSVNTYALDDEKSKYKKVIKIAPAAPKFTVAERHSELAKRRMKLANMIADNSMLIMFSAPLRIYTNDVDYPYRQENNLYYLTALKKGGSTYVMVKEGGKIREILFLPKRNPRAETWNGRMYSNADATRLSGLKAIVDSREQRAFLESLKSKKTFYFKRR